MYALSNEEFTNVQIQCMTATSSSGLSGIQNQVSSRDEGEEDKLSYCIKYELKETNIKPNERRGNLMKQRRFLRKPKSNFTQFAHTSMYLLVIVHCSFFCSITVKLLVQVLVLA